jgi:CheY-like chemotaxis protein
MTAKNLTVLLVDDDDVDVAAVRRAFSTLRIETPIVVARDGSEALAHLRGTDRLPKLDVPALVLLDLNMPPMGGLEFLEELRGDPTLRTTVVFVLTTSNAPSDRRACYEKNVAGYMLKQQPGKSFLDAISMLETYWNVNEFMT